PRVSGPLVPAPVAYAIGAGGLAALGAFAYFEAKVWTGYAHLRDTCIDTHTCSQDDLDTLRTERTGVYVSLGVASVALATSLFLLLYRSSPRSSDSRAALEPRR